MIIEAVLAVFTGPVASFFTGAAFRMVWGEISSYLTRKQEHAQQIEILEAQEKMAASAHTRRQEEIRLQSQLGVQLIQVQSEADNRALETKAWSEISISTSRTTGVYFLDLWNGCIRPALATWAIVMLTLEAFKRITGIELTEDARSVCSAALGIYLADRTLFKRGK